MKTLSEWLIEVMPLLLNHSVEKDERIEFLGKAYEDLQDKYIELRDWSNNADREINKCLWQLHKLRAKIEGNKGNQV